MPDRKTTAADRLVALATEQFTLRCSPSGDPYAVAAGTQIRRPFTGSASLRSALAKLYNDRHGRMPQAAALAAALSVLSETARENGPDPADKLVADTVPEAGEEKGQTTATLLVELANKEYRVLVGDDGNSYAVALNGPNVAWPLRGREGLRQRLARAYFAKYGSAASASALTDAVAVLEGQAMEVDREPIALRLARLGASIVIDMGTADGRCICVLPGSWQILDRSPVLFRRTALTAEMVVPVGGGGDVMDLAELVNADEAEVQLIVGWLIAGMIPDIPHAILALFGEQGTAKTTLMRLLAMLIDPSPAPTRTAPRDEAAWAVTASASWFIGLDNISTISDSQSDMYCRAVTGDARTGRALYTDSDVTVMAFRRLLAMTSIDAGALHGDLGDRLLPIELNRIDAKRRRTDTEVSTSFREEAPALLGSLLDLLAKVLIALPTIKPDGLPRMADFAVVLAAVDQATGWDTVGAYAATAADVAETVIDSDPFATAVRDLARSVGEWSGSASGLGEKLIPDKPPKGWPRSARAISGNLRGITPALRSVGVIVEHSRSSDRTRTRVVTLSLDPDFSPEGPSEPSEPSEKGSDQGKRADGRADGSDANRPTVHQPSDEPSDANTPLDLRECQPADGPDGSDGEIPELSSEWDRDAQLLAEAEAEAGWGAS